ncbi:S-formylglutathione hydrolase [Moraxella caviae]|uniref:S-formylglutathione hydrolase n=1 Tax=Moraxella caviae TaxID=34060 RepID=A0A1T0A0Z8_9GAMM|nr:S-formylglutathione hydrolase [Moraxella caviae]OOR89400.1 S-formylglutathione hydrolase [Moraxella caviae]STZ09878.1 S-formylglutathione hydrolase [Moraxella caviae]VEW12928.1 S-formylglutathione hydrolase [Moraxella caviae]
MKQIEQYSCFVGTQSVWEHFSHSLNCQMKFAIYLPKQAGNQKLPVLYWLSGLTCSEQNFITKSGFQRYAAELGVIVVAPDTSPRGADVPNDDAYDLGQGAGFYLNATQEPWAKHFKMYDYIVDELPDLINAHFPTNGKQAISGHSMGGHGALTIGLKNPDRYASVSAFSPIVAPSQVPWGQKAFLAYLGENAQDWQIYDSVELIKQGKKLPHILVDQGLADQFLNEQLKLNLLEQVCETHGQNAQIRYHEGYDHSYYFIASFIGEHLAYHAKRLAA